MREQTNISQRGFTLIELMVVVGIMVAVIAFALPSFQGIGEGSAVKTGIEKLRVTASLARQHAIMKREIVYLVFPYESSSSDHAFTGFRVYGEKSRYISNWSKLAAGTVFLSANAPNNVFQDSPLQFPYPDAEDPPIDMRYIAFLPDGTAQGGGGGKEVYIVNGFYDEVSGGVESTSSIDWFPRRSLQINGFTGLYRINQDDG